jgi:ribosomal protein S16
MKKKKNKKIREKVIRLRKIGRMYYPIYEIILTFRDNRNRGYIIEKLGFFNPHKNEKIFYINSYRLSY